MKEIKDKLMFVAGILAVIGATVIPLLVYWWGLIWLNGQVAPAILLSFLLGVLMNSAPLLVGAVLAFDNAFNPEQVSSTYKGDWEKEL